MLDDFQEELKDFSGFQITRILSESSERKNVVVEGTFEKGRRSIVALERLPFRQEVLQKILSVRKSHKPHLNSIGIGSMINQSTVSKNVHKKFE